MPFSVHDNVDHPLSLYGASKKANELMAHSYALNHGLAVTGRVHPERILSNANARPGDVLVLTKPLGTGILATAGKAGALAEAHAEALYRSLV